MHIVYVIAPTGGPEAFVKTIAPYLENQKHRVSIIYGVGADRIHSVYPATVRVAYALAGSWHYYLSKLIGNFQALPLRLRTWEYARAVYHALIQIERTDKVNLVEVTEGIPVSLLKKRWAVVVRAHGSDWTFRYFCQDADRRDDAHLIALEARQLVDAQGVTSISHHLAQHLSQFCNFPQDRIQVIPYPIDLDYFRPETQRDNTDALCLLSVGRLERRKGTDILIQALPQIWRRFPGLDVYLVGREAGLKKDELHLQIPKEKRHQVIFPGIVSREQIAEYFRRATIYVSPTQYETFAYTILEAMACGVPVVASAVGAIPEIVRDRVTGLLVPWNDPSALAKALIELLEDPTWRERMGHAARQVAYQYAVDEIGAKNLSFYQSVLALRKN